MLFMPVKPIVLYKIMKGLVGVCDHLKVIFSAPPIIRVVVNVIFTPITVPVRISVCSMEIELLRVLENISTRKRHKTEKGNTINLWSDFTKKGKSLVCSYRIFSRIAMNYKEFYFHTQIVSYSHGSTNML